MILSKKYEGPRTLKPHEVPTLMRLFDDIFWKGQRGTMMRYLPYLYRDLGSRLETAQVITCGGQIVSHVGLYPIEFALGPRRVMAGGIGGVLTQPRFRGQGLMAALLGHSTGLMKRQGVPLSILWGDRFRYSRFGWEPAGAKLDLGFSQPSLAYWDHDPLSVTKADAAACLPAVRRLHSTQPARALRPAGTFLLHLTAQGRRLYLAGPAQKPAAYALVKSWLNKEGKKKWQVDEFAGSTDGILSLFSFLLKQPGTASLQATMPMAYGSWLPPLFRASNAWESSHGGMIGQFKVIDLAGLLRALGLSGLQPALAKARLSPAELVSVLLGPAGPKVLLPPGKLRDTLSAKLPVGLFLWPADHV